MTIGSILLGLALLIAVGVFLGRPFLLPNWRQGNGAFSRRRALEAEKEMLLEQIRDLDFDHDTGKIPDEVHAEEREALVAEAVGIMRRLDEMAPAGSNGARSGMDADIEAAVARVRDAPPDVDIEAAIAQRRSPQPPAGQTTQPTPAADAGPATKTAQGTKFCSQCGQPRDSDDRFCAYCGHRFD